MENRRKNWFVWGLCLLFLLGGKSYANPDTEILRKLFVDELLEGAVNDGRVKEVLASCSVDGTWPEIDYQDVSKIGFQHEKHLGNMLLLSRAYRKKGSAFRGKKQVKEVLNRSLDYWLANDFICENWWWNQIGTPNTIMGILLLMDKELTLQQTEKMLEIVSRGNVNATGARPSGDRIKIAGIQAKSALFKRDDREFEEMIKIIEGEIKFSTERGMQHDFSFHHRVDWVNNTLSYGSGYAEAFAEWAANVSKTRYRFSDQSLQLLVDYYLDGMCKQMVFGKLTDPGVLNRDITRPHERHIWSNKTPERLLAVTNYRRPELQKIIGLRQDEKIIPDPFAKFFWRTDHFVIQRPNYYTSVRMYSTRNANMEEPYNGEGLMNHFRGDGTNYLSLTGEEYQDIAPVYDWMKIPGATTVQLKDMLAENEIQKWGQTDFVGAVTDDLYGAVGFDFKSPHTGLKARKAWFFFDEEYVCLGSGITNRQSLPVVTTLNQCYASGDVRIKDGTGVRSLEKGTRKLENLAWVLHGNVGYVFPKEQQVFVSNQEAAGSWFRVNRQTSSSKEEVRKDIFSLWLDHGIRPEGAAYQYVVLPGAYQDKLDKYTDGNQVSVLSNTPQLQAVRHNGLHIAYAVFYESGTVEITKNLSVSMDSPGLLLVHYTKEGDIQKLAVSDPSRFLGKLHFSMNRKWNVSGNEHIQTVWDEHQQQTHVSICLPRQEYAGKSVVYSK